MIVVAHSVQLNTWSLLTRPILNCGYLNVKVSQNGYGMVEVFMLLSMFKVSYMFSSYFGLLKFGNLWRQNSF